MRRILSGSLDGEAADVLQSILTHSRDCIKILNRAGELEYVSPSAKNALGLNQPSEAIGRVWRDFWPESERASLDAAVLAALSGTSARFDGAIPDGEGGERFWEVTVSPVRGEDGAIGRVLAVSTDVTAQRAAEAHRREELERAENQITHAGNVARELRHRLKNQLAVVNGVTKLLARHTTDAGELAAKLEAKLIALSRAQDLLAIRHDTPLTVEQAVRDILAASGAGERVSIAAIPDMALPEESIQQLALLLGELQTNAIKYGALRDDAGTVTLTGWAADGALGLRWAESCRATVSPTTQGNGGFQLIRRLGSTGSNKAVIHWSDSGIIVEFFVRAAD